MLFKKLYPAAFAPSAYEIDYEDLYRKGYRAILFDIDNTLVPHDAPADERSKELCERLKKTGYQVLFLSNNEEPRVKMFNDEVNCTYLYKAGKPGKAGYLKAMEKTGTTPENTFAVGDQLLTDTWGANNAGLYNIFVGQISKKEPFHIILKRILEKILFFFFKLGGKNT